MEGGGTGRRTPRAGQLLWRVFLSTVQLICLCLGLGGTAQSCNLPSKRRRKERGMGMSSAFQHDLFKQDSYQRVILNVGLSYYLSFPGTGYVTLGFQEGALNCLSEITAPNKQIRMIKMGGIPLCPMEMIFAPHHPVSSAQCYPD